MGMRPFFRSWNGRTLPRAQLFHGTSAQLQSSVQSSTRTLANTHLTHYPATSSTESTTYLLHQNGLYAPSVPHCAAKLPPKTMTATPASSRACLCSSPAWAVHMDERPG
ncbi:hypothetical protein EJ06DRAFT_530529, partial [Trichodelitschia bisporula]